MTGTTAILPDQVAKLLDQRPLRLGTRRSPLAMAQAHEAARRLINAFGLAENAVQLCAVTASGDKVQDRALAEIGGKALWTKELDGSLAHGEIDFSVHSLKDVETIRPAEFAMAAILPRADVRDVLLGAANIAALPQGATLGTSAPRRAAQALHTRPDLNIVLFRGNVATRMAKLQAGEADATLLAAAGLQRLAIKGVGTALDPDNWIPAPSQGAIGVECLAANEGIRELLAAIDCADTRHAVMAERGLLLALGGDCHSPVAAHARLENGMVRLNAALFSMNGQDRVAGEAVFAPGDAEAPKVLAHRLLQDAPNSIRVLFAGE